MVRNMKRFLISLYLPLFILAINNLQASFCKCVPKDYLPVRVFAAPQICRLKFQIDQFATYRGVLKGGSVGVDYRPFCYVYGGLFAEWMMGDCSSQNEMSRYIHDIDAQVRIGYSFPMWNFYKLSFTPFSGIGYLQNVQYLKADTVISSEHFMYSNYYLPVGIISELRVTHTFSFGFLLEWKPSLSDHLKTSYLENVRFSLKRKAGYLLEFPFNLYFGSRAKAQIGIVPYLKREVDGELLAVLPNGASLALPKQSYKYWGLRLTLGAAF